MAGVPRKNAEVAREGPNIRKLNNPPNATVGTVTTGDAVGNVAPTLAIICNNVAAVGKPANTDFAAIAFLSTALAFQPH